MKDIRSIRVFLEVAKQKSFVGAAQHLRLTPASTTRLVAKLENELGQQLFTRTTRQVSLTNAGALAAARYQPIIDELDAATDEFANFSNQGKLNLNAPLSLGLRILPDFVDAFRKAYPQISLTINLNDELIDIMKEDCDLAIRISAPPTDKSTIWRKICEVPRHAIATPEFLETINPLFSPEDINQDDCLSYSSNGEAESWEFLKGKIKRKVRAGSMLISNNGDFLYQAALANHGIAVLPDFIVKQGVENGKVVHVLEEWRVSSLWLTLYYPPYEKLPPLVATFTEFFEEHMRKIEELDFR